MSDTDWHDINERLGDSGGKSHVVGCLSAYVYFRDGKGYLLADVSVEICGVSFMLGMLQCVLIRADAEG